MKNTLLVFLLAVCTLATGCAAKVLHGDDKSVVVRARRADLAGATEIADTYCFQRGLHARAVSKLAEEEFGFECIR